MRDLVAGSGVAAEGIRIGVRSTGCSGFSYQLDFAREGLNEGFKFENPNVKSECGCGESFQV
ncbi:MAG: iron-sulfur cluster assembly accessory protein [Burkholderiaceae bacterium]|nr:iron-sulfur cluster assembly accessory protein [Burkholderiaceae bacterium]